MDFYDFFNINRRSRPTFGTETSRNPRKPAVSSHLWHRDHAKSSKPAVSSLFRHRDLADSPETSGLVPPPAPRPLEIPGNQRSRPSSDTETSRIPRKPTVSSHFRHRDHSESPETDSLVPPSAPRPRGFPENRRSRPTSDTETTRNPRKPIVSSHFRHRDLAESPETGSLVPSLAPRPHEIAGNRQSRPISGTETTRNPRNRQSRPTSGTETSRNPRKPEVSSHFRHRDHSDFPEIGSLVPPSAPRPHRVTAEGAGPRCFWGEAPRKCKKCCRRGK